MHKKVAVFLDRDGVINEVVRREKDGKVSYTAPFTSEEFRSFPEVADVLKRLRVMRMLSIVVTNQPDVVYGNMTPPAMNEIMRRTRELGFDDVFVCPHGRNENCDCKKPKPGMLREAALKHSIDLSCSYIVGDTKTDMEAGRAAGCKSVILIRRSYNENLHDPEIIAVSSLTAAIDWIEMSHNH